MCSFAKFCVFSSFFIILKFQKYSAEENVKIWKPNNNIFNKENWVDPDLKEDCDKVEFGKINTADIFIDKLTAKEFILPLSGNLILLDGGYLKVVSKKSKEKTNCLKLKELQWHHYLNPDNWESDVSKNPAVPDEEKLPCRYDKVKFPNGIYSSVYISEVSSTQTVSALEFGNETFDRLELEAFKATDVGSAVFDAFESDDSRNNFAISERKCLDPSGCTCNRGHDIQCPTKKRIDCLKPVHPIGFCQKICGAFTTFKLEAGFSLNRIKEALEEYTDVATHVSKVSEDRIQVVFSEEKYTGDSVINAEKFLEKLKDNSKEYKVSEVSALKFSGSQTSGDASLWTVIFTSFFFVIGIFGIIFYIYGDHKMPISFGSAASPSLPLSSTYRARFSPREDESGLIFDNQSLSGSVMDLDQSFDNPMYGQVSTAPDIMEEDRNNIYEPATAKVESNKVENSQTNPLSDLSKLNQELKEEIGSDLLQELPKCINTNSAPLIDVDVAPLLEIDEENDDFTG